MWITQTYLSSPEPNARLHIYYLFESYVYSHIEATERLQEELTRISSIYPEVCILLPNPNSADRIEGEMRNNPLWKQFSGDLPGLVVVRKPVEEIDPNKDEMFFITLNHAGYSNDGLGLSPNKEFFAEKLQKLRRLIPDELIWQHRELGKYEGHPKNFSRGLLEAVEMKPGIAGFRVDLKKLWELAREPRKS